MRQIIYGFLPLPDFKEFLKLLNSSEVGYLLIGGYAVNYLPLCACHFESKSSRRFPELSFRRPFQGVLGVNLDGVAVNLISLDDLKANKRMSDGLKDPVDLEQLD